MAWVIPLIWLNRLIGFLLVNRLTLATCCQCGYVTCCNIEGGTPWYTNFVPSLITIWWDGTTSDRSLMSYSLLNSKLCQQKSGPIHDLIFQEVCHTILLESNSHPRLALLSRWFFPRNSWKCWKMGPWNKINNNLIGIRRFQVAYDNWWVWYIQIFIFFVCTLWM